VDALEGFNKACVIIWEEAAAGQRGGRVGWGLWVWVGGSRWVVKVVDNMLNSGVHVHGNWEGVV
jgi:hypothetical protein